METPDSSPPHRPAAAAAELPPATLEGWYALHQLFRLDWPTLKAIGEAERSPALREFGALTDAWSVVGEKGWSGTYRVVGAGLDLMLVHFRSDLEALDAARRAVHASALGDLLLLEREYLSVVELGLYQLTADTARGVDLGDAEVWRREIEAGMAREREKAYVRGRLFPVQPETMPYVCFYPMDKRREAGRNWYRLGLEERARLMAAHGAVGRRYAGRISQVISGSVGLDDWEWAVTLWAGDPLEFKNVITDMRYDEASAEYAEFGSFFVGVRMSPADIETLLPGGGPGEDGES